MDGIDLRYCNPSCFQTRGPKVQKWMFLLFVHVHEEFIFHLILNGFLNEFLWKENPFQKNVKHYYVILPFFLHKMHSKEETFKLFLFFIQFECVFFCKMIILMGYCCTINKFWEFYFQKRPKRTRIVKFCI
jgi:hypothetical protein